MPTQNPELAVWTTDELADEIKARNDQCLMLIVRKGKVEADGTEVFARYTKGPLWTLIGMAEVYAHWARQQFLIETEDCDE